MAGALPVLSYSPEPARPPVWRWFCVYTIGMGATHLIAAMVVTGILLWRDGEGGGEIALAVCLPLAAAFALPLFLPRRNWVWIYDLVLIAFGLTSVLTLPAAVALLIFWIKPQTRAWFQQGT